MKIINSILIFVLLYYAGVIIYSTVKTNLWFLLLGELLFFLVIFINILSPYLKIKNKDKQYIDKLVKDKNKEDKNHKILIKMDLTINGGLVAKS